MNSASVRSRSKSIAEGTPVHEASDVYVAMSGGVDSSVAAAILLQSGCGVVGATMRLAEEGVSPGHDETVQAAERICAHLGIAHVIIDLTDAFRGLASTCERDKERGYTPNPCVGCNESVKFGAFFEACKERGARRFATGHYARLVEVGDAGVRLARGSDGTKDQSYFLYRVPPATLADCVFPLGDKRKSWVIERACELGLPIRTTESQDVCIPELLAPGQDPRAGTLLDLEGRTLAQVDDIAGLTVGQRKGLGLGGDGPWFVVDIDAETRSVTVARREEILRSTIKAEDVVWWAAEGELDCRVQTRYRARPRQAHVIVDGGALTVRLSEPIESPAPGQSVVCYESGIVLGGGIISSAW
jgi:tRNA-specific 2-thiouridylase